MVIDAANGIESQPRKLFEVCRRHRFPIVTFVNKFDRSARDPRALLDGIESTLGIAAAPVNWPVGNADEFPGARPYAQSQWPLAGCSAPPGRYPRKGACRPETGAGRGGRCRRADSQPPPRLLCRRVLPGLPPRSLAVSAGPLRPAVRTRARAPSRSSARPSPT